MSRLPQAERGESGLLVCKEIASAAPRASPGVALLPPRNDSGQVIADTGQFPAGIVLEGEHQRIAAPRSLIRFLFVDGCPGEAQTRFGSGRQ